MSMTEDEINQSLPPRGWDAPLTGNHELNRGLPTGIKCLNYKRCGGYIVYNGNYFCEEFGHNFDQPDGRVKRVGGDCDWALPHGDLDGYNDKPETEKFAKKLYRGLRNERIRFWREHLRREAKREVNRARRAARDS